MMRTTTSRTNATRATGWRAILIFVAILGAALAPAARAAQSVTLAWNASTGSTVAGYMIYSSADGTNYGNSLDAGTNTIWTVTGLQAGTTNYFEVTAYDTNNNQSPPSNPVEFVVPNTTNTVTVQASPASAGSVTGGGSFATGSSVTVTATANSGYTFTNWTQNGAVQSASSSYNFTLASNLTLVANFTMNPTTNTVTVQASPASAGSVTGGGSFATGSSVTVTATANSGYTFTNWTQNGAVQSASSSYSFTLASNLTLVANFTMNPTTNTVAVQASPASAGSVTGGGSFTNGSSVMVQATAKSGYTFTNWTQNGVAQSTSPRYTFTLSSNRTLVANFTTIPITNTVAVLATPANAGSASGGGSFATGSSVTATATANNGYAFTGWTQNGKAQSTSPSFTFTLATNLTLVANFTMTLTTNTSGMQLSVVNSPQRVVTVKFPVTSGNTYSVQASTDLVNWETIWQTTATSNTLVQFQDPAAPNLPTRFYRTVSN
jgi:uncharacterized repeat protein (TIGR02543 family)